MGWQDRSYYRDSGSGSGNPLMWLMTGSVPLFTAFGIRVRAHASLLLMVVLVLLFGLGQGFTWQDRVQSMAILFGIILLHEFGHCFAARSVGGEAHEILMWPLGGLAMAHAPRRPWPTFVTVAGGPFVNLLICAVCGTILYLTRGWVPWNPLWTTPYGQWQGWFDVVRYAYWIYQVSWMLLLFNLLPIFPLDGGQLLQSILWPKFGYYKSMNFACITGMVGAIAGGMVALATFSIMLALLAYSGFITCLNMRRSLLAAGPWGFQDEDGMDYSASLSNAHDHQKHHKLNKRLLKRAQKREAEERDEQDRVDQILDKVSAHGMNSLTYWEKRALKKATERQRRRDEEVHEEMGRKGF